MTLTRLQLSSKSEVMDFKYFAFTGLTLISLIAGVLCNPVPFPSEDSSGSNPAFTFFKRNFPRTKSSLTATNGRIAYLRSAPERVRSYVIQLKQLSVECL